MSRRVFGIIPARYGSSRFPGKPLALIHGKPMVWHVYTRATQAKHLERVVLASDDDRILDACRELGIPALRTRSDHQSGTDRVAEAADQLGLTDKDAVINIQGDEPALEPAMLDDLALAMRDETGPDVATMATPVSETDAQSPDLVKVVVAQDGRALYFSRSPVPHMRTKPEDGGECPYWGHIGLYAFRLPALKRFVSLGPSPLEKRECLEQLRLLEHTIDIRVLFTRHTSCGVDRPEDILRAEERLAPQGRFQE